MYGISHGCDLVKGHTMHNPKTRLHVCLANNKLNFMKAALNEETAETVIDLYEQLTMFLFINVYLLHISLTYSENMLSAKC